MCQRHGANCAESIQIPHFPVQNILLFQTMAIANFRYVVQSDAEIFGSRPEKRHRHSRCRPGPSQPCIAWVGHHAICAVFFPSPINFIYRISGDFFFRRLISNIYLYLDKLQRSLPVSSILLTTQHRTMSSTAQLRSLNINNINPHVKKAKYAVRGELAVRSEEYRAKLAKGATDIPFEKIISANIGNPQQLDQKPITFFRQVLSLLEYPPLLEHEDVLLNQLGYKSDVIERARWLLKTVGSVGAYSASAGAVGIKDSVARFIEGKASVPELCTNLTIGSRTRWPPSRPERYLPLCRRLFRCQYSLAHYLRLAEHWRTCPYSTIPALHCFTFGSQCRVRSLLPR